LSKSVSSYESRKKGETGLDADILLLDHDLNINAVFAKGIEVVENGVLLKKWTYKK